MNNLMEKSDEQSVELPTNRWSDGWPSSSASRSGRSRKKVLCEWMIEDDVMRVLDCDL